MVESENTFKERVMEMLERKEVGDFQTELEHLIRSDIKRSDIFVLMGSPVDFIRYKNLIHQGVQALLDTKKCEQVLEQKNKELMDLVFSNEEVDRSVIHTKLKEVSVIKDQACIKRKELEKMRDDHRSFINDLNYRSYDHVCKVEV